MSRLSHWLSRWLGQPQDRRRGRRAGPRERLLLELLEPRLAPPVNFSISDPLPSPEGDSGTSSLLFVVTRSGDTKPAVQVDFTTQDGAGPNGARAGIDYTATSGTLYFAAGQATTTIAVPIVGNTLLQSNRTLTVVLAQPLISAAFAPQQTFAAGNSARSMAQADVNGDGRPDLLVANTVANSVSVFLNTTGPGATAAGFAPQQNFATGSHPYS